MQPDNPRPFPPTIQAILKADLIVAGPGSLYTSIIPNLLVAEIVSAIRASATLKILICNVATQPGETDNYSLDDHVQAIEAHTTVIESEPEMAYHHNKLGPNLFNYVLANCNLSRPIPETMNLHPILPIPPTDNSYQVIQADVVDEQYPGGTTQPNWRIS